MVKLKSFNNVFQIILFVIIASIIVNVCPVNGDKCGEYEFQCHTGDKKCIKTEFVCDKKKDCSDNSDETDCGSCIAPDWHQCLNADTCISSSFLCDGQEHCPDGDDENNCSNVKHVHAICGKYEYTCLDKTCIPLDMVCDGRKQCPDGSDEDIGCLHAAEQCKGFFCTNKKCLESHLWVCDGMDDCGDQSDEQGCAYNCNPDEGKFLCKDNETCIPLTNVCDKIPQCPDKSDENGFCADDKYNCDKLSCPSMSKCYKFPDTGGKCVCPKGYTYDKANNKCADIDECKIFGTCSQICKNTEGSFECSCIDKYILNNDNKTCKVQGGEALLLYTTQKSVVGIYLKSRHMYKVAQNLSQVIGVAYDGEYIYWTSIKHQLESIVRAREDGSQQEILLTSGLETPEDLALDWLTGNLYFSDNVLKHISVCSNHGYNCKILVTINVDHPRGIALYPQKGIMFWSDWGNKPMIATSLMDGSNVKPLVTKDVHWPNCITMDFPNERLYWVDAKLTKIESVNVDGSDRRTVLSDILKHPYGISVFEDRLYWSDWETKSIHSCNKFTGKKHEVLVKDKRIYAVHIFHSAIQPKVQHSCLNSGCSHLCLLAGNSSNCACPEDLILGVDQKTCINVVKKQKLYLGIGSYLIEMAHSTFGRHQIVKSYPLTMLIHNMEYNSINGSIFIADNIRKVIYEFNPINKHFKELVKTNIGNVTAMSFDNLAQNLYWTDSQRHTVEVLSLRTNHRAIVHFFLGLDKPIGLVVIPEKGKMFVALQSRNYAHIDTLDLHGRGQQHHTYETELGNGGIQLQMDLNSKTIFWLDRNEQKLEFANYETYTRSSFRNRLDQPFSMALIDEDILWSTKNSQSIYWTSKNNFGSIKKFDIENPKVHFHSSEYYEISLLSSKPIIVTLDHRCLHNNGGCSHVCVSTGKFSSSCLCPTGMVFKDNTNLTCIESLDCEFKCESGECLTSSRKCNGNKDCADGSDEKYCDTKDFEKGAKKICGYDQFACHDGIQCVHNLLRCDKEYDCMDKSDEHGCENIDHFTKCRDNQFSCNNGHCVDLTTLCDGFDDCDDNSDEKHCMKSKDNQMKSCSKNMFQCTVGTCIPKSWECDGQVECVDGSDEHDKCASKGCSNGMVQCRLGQCIDKKLICDGHNDCGDNSDELDCNNSTRQIVCGDEVDSFGDPKKFQCSSNLTICLDISAKCNKTAECPRGEDEIGCGGCSYYEFSCDNNDCIRKEFRCDGEKDCSDGSDEIGCKSYNSTWKENDHFTTTCHDHMFDCKDGTCLDYSRVCDNKNDCSDGLDESNMCKTACKPNPCDHICTPSPYGGICSCETGYRLNGDKKTCSDIDECAETQPCAQLCQNNLGSYRCSCYPEYLLRTDKSSCKSIQGKQFLLFTSFDQARTLSENPISLKVMWNTNDSRITGLDVDIKEKKAYFTIQDSSNIYQYNLDKGGFKYLADPGLKGKLAVDWITNNVYVVKKGGSDSLIVCNFEKNTCARIIKFRVKDSVKSIAIDAINKYLFYSVTFASTFGTPKTTIFQSSLDGTKAKALVTASMYVTALEADPNKKELYFMDAHSRTLQSIKYSGSSAKPIILVKKNNAIKNPSGISIFENIAFISNTGSPEAVRCQLYGDKTCLAFNLNVYNVEDIVVVGSSRQIESTNVCANNNCSVICVQASLGPKCICYDGQYAAPGVFCPKPLNYEADESSISKISLNDELINDQTVSTSSSNAATLAICLTIMGLILIGLCGYILYRRRAGHGNFLINMHFQNPLQRSGQQHSSSPSVTTHIQQNKSTEGSTSSIKMCRPIKRFLQSGKGTQITMETSKLDERNSPPSKLITFGGASRFMDDSDPECNRDDGNYDDDPRSSLIP